MHLGWTGPVWVDGIPHSVEHLFHSVSIHVGPIAIMGGLIFVGLSFFVVSRSVAKSRSGFVHVGW